MVIALEVVSFDGDGTLWDVRAAARAALESTAVAISKRLPAGTLPVTVERLEIERDQVETDHPDWKMEQLRRESFRRVIQKAGLDPRIAEELWGAFIECRLESTQPYSDVVPAITAIRTKGLRTALLSNGNTRPERIGLGGMFEFVQIGELIDVRKPDPEFYRRAAGAMGTNVESMLHIGDSRMEDFDAARRAGVHTLLLQRTNGTSGQAPSHILSSLSELPVIIDQMLTDRFTTPESARPYGIAE